MTVAQVMQTDLILVDHDENLVAVCALFLQQNGYFLCVQKEGTVIAVMTRRDMKHIIADAMGIVVL